MNNHTFYYKGKFYPSFEIAFRLEANKLYKICCDDKPEEIVKGENLLNRIKAGEFNNRSGTMEGPVSRG